jgi:ferredoxin
MSKYKIIFNREKCEENRVCEAVCPKFWKFNENEGKMHLKGEKEVKPGIFEAEISEADYKCNKNAEENCPKKAIKIQKLK